MKNILLGCMLFTICCAITISCTKKTPTERACNLTGKTWTCKAGKTTINPDSLYVLVDTLNNKIIMGVQDTARGFRAYLVVNYPLQNFDLPMGKDTFGFVTANTSYGNLSMAQYGNFALHINPDKTICGNFFWHNNASKLYVTQGQFSNIPYTYYK